MNARDMILADRVSKPIRLPLNVDLIPQEMRKERRWVTWGYEWRERQDGSGKWQKVPRSKWTKQENWLTIDEAAKKLDGDRTVDGIGFVLGDGWMGVDIDDCVNPINRQLQPVAESIVRKLNTYAEISPTGTGVKAILKGSHNTAFSEDPHIEIYGAGRYFTVTSNRLEIGNNEVKKDTGGIDWLVSTYVSQSSETDLLGAKENFPIEVVADALAHIPSDIAEEYSEWIAVGHAAKSAGEEMFEPWVEWSAKADSFGGEDECRAKWDSMNPSRTGPRKIFSLARMGGWSPPGKPEIVLGSCVPETAKTALVNLSRVGFDATWVTFEEGQDSQTYRRNGGLVGINFERELPEIYILNRGQVLDRIHTGSRFLKRTKDGFAPCPVGKDVRDTVYDLGGMSKAVRNLSAVITAPTIRPDGTILQEAGWDEATGIYYHQAIKYGQIPVKPTKHEIKRSIDMLLHVIKDFPVKEIGTDRASWLAMLLTLVGRPCFSGCCPMFVISGNVPGCGKGLFVDVAHAIAYGVPLPKRGYVTREEEMEKLVLSAILAGTPAICFDNVRGRIGGQVIEATLTAPTFSGRELGASKYHTGIDNRIIWLATGNNLGFQGDFARRAIPIILRSPLDKPNKRTDMEHSDLLGWVKGNRAGLVVSALTVLRGFFEAGKPRTDKRAMASFEDWSTTIRDCVVWTGIGDPLDSEKHAEQEDESTDILTCLMGGIKEIFSKHPELEKTGVSTKQMLSIASQDFDGEDYPQLLEAIEGLGDRGKRALGRSIGQYVDRPLNGEMIRKDKYLKTYKIEAVVSNEFAEVW
jgi:hypothetical protein